MLIRLSPSGTPIQNANGALVDVGPGMVLQKDTVHTPVDAPLSGPLTGADTVFGLDALTPLLARVENPQEGTSYQARLDFDLINTDAGNGIVDYRIEYSLEGDAGPWIPWAETSSTVPGNGAATQGFGHYSLTAGPSLGGPELGIINGTTTELVVRAVIAAPSGSLIFIESAGPDGTCVLTLEENL